MTYEEAIAVRKRQIANQPVGAGDIATANRVIAHQRSMGRVFGNESPAPVAQAPAPLPPQRTALPPGCISVSEWLRTLPRSESYKPVAAGASAAKH